MCSGLFGIRRGVFFFRTDLFVMGYGELEMGDGVIDVGEEARLLLIEIKVLKSKNQKFENSRRRKKVKSQLGTEPGAK